MSEKKITLSGAFLSAFLLGFRWALLVSALGVAVGMSIGQFAGIVYGTYIVGAGVLLGLGLFTLRFLWLALRRVDEAKEATSSESPQGEGESEGDSAQEGSPAEMPLRFKVFGAGAGLLLLVFAGPFVADQLERAVKTTFRDTSREGVIERLQNNKAVEGDYELLEFDDAPRIVAAYEAKPSGELLKALIHLENPAGLPTLEKAGADGTLTYFETVPALLRTQDVEFSPRAHALAIRIGAAAVAQELIKAQEGFDTWTKAFAQDCKLLGELGVKEAVALVAPLDPEAVLVAALETPLALVRESVRRASAEERKAWLEAGGAEASKHLFVFLGAHEALDPTLTLQRLEGFMKALPETEAKLPGLWPKSHRQHLFLPGADGVGLRLLRVAAERLPEAFPSILDRYLSKGSAQRHHTLCALLDVRGYASSPELTETLVKERPRLIPWFDDARVIFKTEDEFGYSLGRATLFAEVRVCDFAAAAYVSRNSQPTDPAFTMNGHPKARDEALARLREQLAR